MAIRFTESAGHPNTGNNWPKGLTRTGFELRQPPGRVASLYSVYCQKMNPMAVLVDEAVIAAAPTRFLVAGMGELGSRLTPAAAPNRKIYAAD